MARQKKISIKIITLFPDFIQSYTKFGIIAKAVKNELLNFIPINLRKFGLDERQTVDGRPYGGGVGMVLRADVLHKAIQFVRKSKIVNLKSRVILLTPSGKRFTQKHAQRLAMYEELIFISGRYEGYDERITKFVDEEISIGDYVLMGGELPALVVTEAVLRLLPRVIGKIESIEHESFSLTRLIDGRQEDEYLLEYPQYTKPEAWSIKHGTGSKKKAIVLKVPKVLLTGHHANIEKWRKEEALKRTKKRRPDLLTN